MRTVRKAAVVLVILGGLAGAMTLNQLASSRAQTAPLAPKLYDCARVVQSMTAHPLHHYICAWNA